MRWALVVGWMAVVFYFSSQSGDTSGELSHGLVAAIQNVFPALDPSTITVLIRKGAHVSEYAVLGALLAFALRVSTTPGRAWLAVMGAVAYAVSDEIHQTFVPGRVGAVGDVLIDSVGVMLGVGFVVWLRVVQRNKGRERGRQWAS